MMARMVEFSCVSRSESAGGVNRKDKAITVTEVVQTFVTDCTFLLSGLGSISIVTHSVSSELVYLTGLAY
jgi:hypothetical protein